MEKYRPTTLIKRPNILARKVEKLEGVSAEALIGRSLSMVKKEAAGFIDWVGEDLKQIVASAGKLSAGATPQAPHIAQIFRGAADIRDQGSVCGYPLATRIAGLLCAFVDQAEHLDPREADLVVAHTDALKTIIAARIKNERSKLAKDLVANLESAAGKLRQPPTDT